MIHTPLTPVVIAPGIVNEIVVDIVNGIGMDPGSLGNDETTWTLIAVPHDQ